MNNSENRHSEFYLDRKDQWVWIPSSDDSDYAQLIRCLNNPSKKAMADGKRIANAWLSKNLNEKKVRIHEKTGLRIFEVERHLDPTLVEADYGAPQRGIGFSNSFVKATRLGRYPRQTSLGDRYITHQTQAEVITTRLCKEGYRNLIKKDACKALNIHFSNGGVTGAFSRTIDVIIDAFKTYAPVREKLRLEKRGGILVPVPTYGLFLWKIRKSLEKNTDILLLPVHRFETGAVDPKSLEMQLSYCREESIMPIAYYDCNPHNPTGHVREKEETKSIAKIILTHTRSRAEPHPAFVLSLLEKGVVSTDAAEDWYDYFHTSFYNPLILDDMSYEDLQFDENKKPYSFAQIDEEVAGMSVVFKGVSKIGLPGLRIGMAIGPKSLIDILNYNQVMEEFCASAYGVDVLAARYGQRHKKFQNHIKELRSLHANNAKLFECFFKGIENVEGLGEEQKRKIIKSYAQYEKISTETSHQILSKGLPSMRLMGTHEGGFFRNVDFTQYRGCPIYIMFKGENEICGSTLETSLELKYVLRDFGIDAVSGRSQGYPDSSLNMRFTTSISDEELFRLFDGLRAMEHYFLGPKPQIQPDLFRDYARYPV